MKTKWGVLDVATPKNAEDQPNWIKREKNDRVALYGENADTKNILRVTTTYGRAFLYLESSVPIAIAV